LEKHLIKAYVIATLQSQLTDICIIMIDYDTILRHVCGFHIKNNHSRIHKSTS